MVETGRNIYNKPMRAIDLTKTLKKHKNGWVSISSDYKKVIASASSLSALVKEIQRKGNPRGYIMRAAKDYSRYVG